MIGYCNFDFSPESLKLIVEDLCQNLTISVKEDSAHVGIFSYLKSNKIWASF